MVSSETVGVVVVELESFALAATPALLIHEGALLSVSLRHPPPDGHWHVTGFR
jgi:hypothetical protein